MRTMDLPIRKNVLGMTPYSPGKPIDEVKRELGLARVIKLASNENPFGPSPKAVEAVRQAASQMHIYPDGATFAFKQAVSKKFGVKPSQILVGNGSDELIHLLGLILLGSSDDELMMGDPGFSRYDASAHLAPSKLVKIPLDSAMRHDLDAMAEAITPNTRLIFIANPNNPTGTIVKKADWERFLSRVPKQTAVVIDEAYAEYSDWHSDFASGPDYLADHPNLIVLRTFSKVYGLAGIRLGFGFASEEVVDAVNRAREPFDVNSLAQVAGIAALDDADHLSRSVEWNRQGVAKLSEMFCEMGARPYESYANFVLADLGRPAEPVFKSLLQQGIITRHGAAIGIPTALRVSVGTPDELEEFGAALKRSAT